MDVLNGYRDSHVSSSDDDSDSDKECTVWKRATVKKSGENDMGKTEVKEITESPIESKPVRKRNTIWCEVLQDQLISEDLKECLLKNKPRDYGSRGKESYDYTLKYSDPRSEQDSDCHMSDNALEEEPPNSKIQHPPRFRFHRNIKKFVKLDSAELDASRKINKVLNEKKFYLIQRIVKTIGIEKAMSLLSMTQEIEDNGGMMINSNTRRRTPGGVYIQLLKSDKSVTQEMLDKIFEGEMSAIEVKKYYAEIKKNKKKLKRRGKDGLKKISKTSVKKSNETVPMDAEIATHLEFEKSNVDNKPPFVSILNKNSSENISDLEEGEIED